MKYKMSNDKKLNMKNEITTNHAQGHNANIVLAVSGPSEEEIDLAALQYATKMSAAPDKETPDWIMTDFKAGIAWLLRYQAACASGARDTVAERGMQIKIPTAQEYIDFMKKQYNDETDERKSSEGQP